jgi:hypothetical protein
VQQFIKQHKQPAWIDGVIDDAGVIDGAIGTVAVIVDHDRQ